MTRILGTVLGLALAVSASPAFAASLSNGSGQSCGGFSGTWHFVNNQNGGVVTTLDACFSSGCVSGVQATSVNKSTAHYYVSASGTLVSASNSSPGKLVLSDFSCDGKCDPKPEDCSNKIDDDCDGLVDGEDSDCKK
jgi:hypothetical protein